VIKLVEKCHERNATVARVATERMLPEPDLFGNTTSTGCSSHDPLCGGITSNIGNQIFMKYFLPKKKYFTLF